MSKEQLVEISRGKITGPSPASNNIQLMDFPKMEEGLDSMCYLNSNDEKQKAKKKNFFSFFSMLMRAKTFAQNMRSHSSMKNIDSLKQRQFHIIGDSAFDELNKSDDESVKEIHRSLRQKITGRTKVSFNPSLFF